MELRDQKAGSETHSAAGHPHHGSDTDDHPRVVDITTTQREPLRSYSEPKHAYLPSRRPLYTVGNLRMLALLVKRLSTGLG